MTSETEGSSEHNLPTPELYSQINELEPDAQDYNQQDIVEDRAEDSHEDEDDSDSSLDDLPPLVDNLTYSQGLAPDLRALTDDHEDFTVNAEHNGGNPYGGVILDTVFNRLSAIRKRKKLEKKVEKKVEEKVKKKAESEEIKSSTQFQSLPAELQQMIWERFCPDLRNQGCVYDFRGINFRSSDGGQATFQRGALLEQQTKPTRTLLAISRKTREIAQIRFPSVLALGQRRLNIRVPYNSSLDIIRLYLAYMPHMETEQVTAMYDFLSDVKMFAVDITTGWYSYQNRPWEILNLLLGFRSLSTVFIERKFTTRGPQSLGWCRSAENAVTYRFDPTADDAWHIESVYVWPDASKLDTYHAEFSGNLAPELNARLPNMFDNHHYLVGVLSMYVWTNKWNVGQYDKFIDAGGKLEEWTDEPKADPNEPSNDSNDPGDDETLPAGEHSNQMPQQSGGDSTELDSGGTDSSEDKHAEETDGGYNEGPDDAASSLTPSPAERYADCLVMSQDMDIIDDSDWETVSDSGTESDSFDEV